MLVVISDLHFEEEKSRSIEGDGSQEPIRAVRNIHPRAFTKILCRLDEQAQRDGAEKMDLVLAGDIFDLHRTALWFQNNPKEVRPYVSAATVDSDLEAKVLEVLHATNEENSAVWEILSAFRRLANDGTYSDEAGQERQFCVPVEIQYLPGNHDRLANATPAIRRTVREFLGVTVSEDPFPHVLRFDEARAIVRHGHEYDAYNFSQDLEEMEELPLQLTASAYDDPPFGDFITVEIASRISEAFREIHGDDKILNDPLLRTVYERILEFDDLRPMRAILNFLLYMPDSGYSPERIWDEAVEPVLLALLDTLHDHPFMNQWLDKMDQKGPDVIDAIQAVLGLQAWKWGGVSLRKVQFLSDLALRAHSEESGPHHLAAREVPILNQEHLFVVAGHTHSPAVKLIGLPQNEEQYYVDTGTWRQQIPATPDFKRFGRIKSLTYAVLYGPNEDPRNPTLPGKTASLDYWSGVTQRWKQT